MVTKSLPDSFATHAETGTNFSSTSEDPLGAPLHPRCLCAPYVPDEILISVVGRLHVTSGNPTTLSTFRDLFNCRPFTLSAWIPPHIVNLAQQLPGDLAENMRSILLNHTLFPLSAIFTGTPYPSVISSSDAGSPRLPKQMSFETTRLCLHCLHQDVDEFGVRYVHRSHQAPGVRTCSKHGVELIYKCPFCECSLGRSNDLVLTPWRRCVCKKYVFDFPQRVEKDPDLVSLSYSRFISELLLAPLTPVPPRALVECYRSQARDLGFCWGNDQVSRNDLLKEMEKFYGTEFLGEVDIAYQQGRLSGWFNMLCSSTTAEPPLSRHLILAHFLFRDAGHFWKKLGGFMDVDGIHVSGQSGVEKMNLVRRKSAPGTAKLTVEQRARDLMRELIDHARKIPNCSVEDMWAANYGMMKRLVSLNPDAILELRKKLKSLKPHSVKQGKWYDVSEADNKRAEAIRDLAAALYESAEKPERVNVNRLSTGVRWNPYSVNHERYPESLEAFKESIESNWHFYARRILWAKLTNKHGSDSAIKHLSGVEYHRALVLIEFFQDLDNSIQLKIGTISSLLSGRGIDRNWVGPCPDRDFPPTGRSYYAKR